MFGFTQESLISNKSVSDGRRILRSIKHPKNKTAEKRKTREEPRQKEVAPQKKSVVYDDDYEDDGDDVICEQYSLPEQNQDYIDQNTRSMREYAAGWNEAVELSQDREVLKAKLKRLEEEVSSRSERYLFLIAKLTEENLELNAELKLIKDDLENKRLCTLEMWIVNGQKKKARVDNE
jgi:hypothetical protein